MAPKDKSGAGGRGRGSGSNGGSKPVSKAAGSRLVKMTAEQAKARASEQSRMLGHLKYNADKDPDAKAALDMYGTLDKDEKIRFLSDFNANRKKPNGLKFYMNYGREVKKTEENSYDSIENYYTRFAFPLFLTCSYSKGGFCISS